MFTLEETVTTSRVDRNGELKLFAALQMMQDCSELWLDTEPAARDYFSRNGYAQLLASRQVEVVRVPAFGERLTCTTSVYECHESFGFRNTFIRDAQGLDCYRSWSMGAFVERATGRLIRIPERIIAMMTPEPRLDMNYGDRRIRVPATAGEQRRMECSVLRDDIDYNGHMNNAHYIRLALEVTEEDIRPTGLRVEFRRPVRLGDPLTVRLLAEEQTRYVEISGPAGQAALVEFRS